MPDISYNREFIHSNWEDNKDIVQAGGENGFNEKFHAIEDEFDRISSTFNDVDSEIKKIQRLQFIASRSGINLLQNGVSEEFPVEIYERTGLPENVEIIYSVVIFPSNGSTHIQHTFLYRSLPGNRVAVTVQFYNPGATQSTFNFRILALAL